MDSEDELHRIVWQDYLRLAEAEPEFEYSGVAYLGPSTGTL